MVIRVVRNRIPRAAGGGRRRSEIGLKQLQVVVVLFLILSCFTIQFSTTIETSNNSYYSVAISTESESKTPQPVPPTTLPTTVSRSKPAQMFALMTESRCRQSTILVLRNVAKKLASNVPILLYHGEHNAACTTAMVRSDHELASLRQTGRLIIKEDDRIDNGTQLYDSNNWNNRLYKNVDFWEEVRAYGTYVLTIQHDTLICSDAPPPLKKFIGGITSPKKKSPGVSPSTNFNRHYLNGGLSVRNVKWVIDCLQDRVAPIVEDAHYNKCDNGISSVTILEAMSFSSDNGFTNCFDWEGKRRCPWGVHKPWMRAESKDYKELVEYCPEIESLKQAQREWTPPPPTTASQPSTQSKQGSLTHIPPPQ